MKSQNVRAVAYEPGSGFVFPEGEVPPAMPSAAGTLEGVAVPLAQFMQLTKIPIVVYFGDNIPEQPTANPGQDNWRVRLAMARLWRDAWTRSRRSSPPRWRRRAVVRLRRQKTFAGKLAPKPCVVSDYLVSRSLSVVRVSCQIHQSYGGVWGYPFGESSHAS